MDIGFELFSLNSLVCGLLSSKRTGHMLLFCVGEQTIPVLLYNGITLKHSIFRFYLR